MNRNVESHFAYNPTNIDISRSQFDMSHTVKFSGNAGDVIPFECTEVLPGDTFKITTSKVVRLQTLVAPIMDSVYLDTYWFFVPSRLVWDHWKNFMGESDNAWIPEVEYTTPKLVAPEDGFGVGSVADYMGVSPRVNAGYKINALPFRCYAKICDDWFRDENLTDPLVINTGDSDTNGNTVTDNDLYCANGGPLFKAAKYHDMFTSALPAPQAGPSVSVPIAGLAKVGVNGANFHDGKINDTSDTGMVMRDWLGLDGSIQATQVNNVGGSPKTVYARNQSEWKGYYPLNLYADLSTASSVSINDLRLAFQIQKFYERSARGGRRYIETLKSQFGVTSPDARLQRSEYLGGNRVPLNIHEVTNNTQGESAFLGDLGAMSKTNDVHDDFVHSFTEHGYVIGCCVVRYEHSYSQGIPKMFLRDTMFDYYWPVFANIGETPIKKVQLFFDPTTNDEVFGYQEPWCEYRYQENRVAAEMRPDVANTLASWHLSDDYDSAPSLSDEWIREDKTNLDRALAVTSEVSNQFFADIYIQNIATRPMPVYSIPGLIDHN